MPDSRQDLSNSLHTSSFAAAAACSRSSSPSSPSSGYPDGDILDRLFRRPAYIFGGSLDSARQSAIASDRWLMVNLLRTGDFQSDCQNRDVWNTAAVTDLITEHFVMIQYGSDTPLGRSYAEMYPVRNYPYIAILDPRTGAIVKSVDRVVTKEEVLRMIRSFLQENGDNLSAEEQERIRSGRAVSTMDDDEQIRLALITSALEQGSELTDEQLERELAVIKQSKRPRHSPAAAPAVVDLSVDSDDDGASGLAGSGSPGGPGPDAAAAAAGSPPAGVDVSPAEPPHPSLGVAAAERVYDPKAPGSAPTRLRLRHPGGQVVCSFDRNDPVRSLYAHVRAICDAAAFPHGFEISSTLSGLGDEAGTAIPSSQRLDDTLADVGFVNCMLHVIPVELD
ncbi:hypothetical protein, variant [Fonticula alba]|uniref:UAS domain-containing protein n=1 Tax=Fonticula alba TaxID=691883 RepID=A0A058Z2N7_FONAL|nr:hypothetical protein, variant [Fonticula alba]KCV68203.1 hypothetical protein, variant [Fonticula alba]|eukprot:XP_009497257.1 hypothetical protein, variant [Fonticula alba]